MMQHDLLLQAQYFLSQARAFERDGLTASAEIARQMAKEKMEIFELNKMVQDYEERILQAKEEGNTILAHALTSCMIEQHIQTRRSLK